MRSNIARMFSKHRILLMLKFHDGLQDAKPQACSLTRSQKKTVLRAIEMHWPVACIKEAEGYIDTGAASPGRPTFGGCKERLGSCNASLF